MWINLSRFSFVFLIMFATPSIAQKVQAQPLRWNPYRDIGGSCVYGGAGELLYAPKGSDCKDRRDNPGSKTEALESEFPSLPPALRTEAESLLADHAHIAEELARLRRSIATEKKKNVLLAADRVIDELTRHHAREEKFIRSISPRQE